MRALRSTGTAIATPIPCGVPVTSSATGRLGWHSKGGK